MKKLLVIANGAPYRDTHTLETIEAAMVGAVFDFEVSLLLVGDGVWNLVGHQDATAMGRRTVGKVISALPDYEVNHILACADALAARNLSVTDLLDGVTPVSAAEQRALLSEQELVMGTVG